MKQNLTIEQSATLIARGISAEKASAFDDIRTVIDGVQTFCPSTKTLFTLPDLLSLLPQAERDLGGIMIDFDVERGKWASTYEFSDYMAREDELIDSLYKLILHLLDNHVKLD